MNSTFLKDNGVALFSFVIVVLTAVQQMTDYSVVGILQVLALAISSGVVIIVPLLKTSWAGGLKTGLDIVGAAIVIVIPFVGQAISGHPVTGPQYVIMAIAIIKAGATEIGIQIRTDWGATTPLALSSGATVVAQQSNAADLISKSNAAATPAAKRATTKKVSS